MPIRPQIADEPGGVLFLTDWPSDEDEVKGFPLVGSDGHLLNRALRAASMTLPGAVPQDFEPALLPEARRLLWERRGHSFASVLGEQPNAAAREALGGTPRAIKEAMACDEGWREQVALRELLERLRPNVIVPLEPLALWTLTGYSSLDDWRGAPMKTHAGWKLLPTYSPRRILQQYRLFGPLIADLMKVRNEARFPEIRPLEVALWLEPELSDLQDFGRDHIAGASLLTLDIETALGQIVCIQIGTSPTTAIVVPFVDYRKPSRSYWDTAIDELAAWEWVRGVLEGPLPKLGQNFTAYDAYWLLEKYGIGVRNLRDDLRLMHHVLQPELPKSLAFMGALYTQMPRWKSSIRHGADSSAREKRDA